jgi:DNA-binding Lrp family transcriptional regulator
MNVQPLYLHIVRILSERDRIPVEMLAIKVGTTTTSIIDSLQKLEKLNIVKMDAARRSVSLSNPDSIPSMDQFYSLAG